MNTWMNDPRYLAQIGHSLGALMLVTLPTLFFGWHTMWIPVTMIPIAAAIKEFWYDANYELPKQTTFDNALDFTFYMLGMTVGVGIMSLAHHLGRVQ